ncbi:MAG TPA: DUF362 domain-containing protein [Candidatus Paceibacterota bacterium]|nr:DUF362 domain-containing protein [Candidatus Paceibacterota bacterium]
MRQSSCWGRRTFVRQGVGAAAGIAFGSIGCGSPSGSPSGPSPTPSPAGPAVALVRVPDYPGSYAALSQAFDLIGGIETLVRHKTVTVKVNLTGTPTELFGRPSQETYVNHGDTMLALVTHLANAGAHRIRIVESAGSSNALEPFAASYGWDVAALHVAGPVEFENTRNLGTSGTYLHVPSPSGLLFDSFDLNRAFDTDVMVSLAKMKNHRAAGVTLTLKNLFGILPNSLYGNDAPREDASESRHTLHQRIGGPLHPGEKDILADAPATVRVPRIITDICSARPIHLAIVEGITTMSGGEGPWSPREDLRFQTPGVMIVGTDPVATDAVATAVMGYDDPLSSTAAPFHFCENHLRFAHDAGLGVGELSRIDVRGERIEDVRTPFAWR